jgi:hypothetical protein
VRNGHAESDVVDREVISMGSDPTEPGERELRRPAREEVFVANVTERADDGETCSISPLPRSGHVLESEWIAAVEGSFVPLEEMR